jgi:hypothetical protein
MLAHFTNTAWKTVTESAVHVFADTSPPTFLLELLPTSVLIRQCFLTISSLESQFRLAILLMM